MEESMPIALKLLHPGNRFDAYRSVLVAPCGVCPGMCLAAESGRPYIDLLRGAKQDCFTEWVGGIRAALGSRGISTAVFRAPAWTPMMCLWPAGVRERLSRESGKFDAVAVIGCESAAATVTGAVDLPAEAVVQLAETRGIANFKMEFYPPFRIGLAGSPGGTEGSGLTSPALNKRNHITREVSQ
jgi:hypothetical protein